jgi:hypothetical protein
MTRTETRSAPEITLETVTTTPEENAYKIIAFLRRGFLPPDGPKTYTNGHHTETDLEPEVTIQD